VALDAACGTGRFAEFLAARGHQVIGVDSSPDLLALRAALSLGLQVRGCEEPGGRQPGELPDAPLPESATGIGDWQDWPWSLMDYLPSVARASRGRRPVLVIWHFQLPAA
jgi:SAM-dependent methyltransferase